ncbi:MULTISPECIES: phytanoyl-CoA dioxygenase family protein [Cyanophyceae]|uniref:phytanoyl-CoA dioxygenase family protein n=1 Tax=Cyanophyceae TaxID=3028117 RepID=UPI0016893847|nr:phytanoyl-CoA dioxygenase family protein [Trichocoleus sp. FACHB-69]MBD1934150.1 phytanoyl-CoA dioxygenase family protein [Trichocoleus sp. FACHB-69]
MITKRYNNQQIQSFAQSVWNDGYCVLPNYFSPATLNSWREAFAPMLSDHIAREGKLRNRGTSRYYVTLPFTAPFADPSIYEDDDILAIVELLVGKDAVMCQLATDTPLLGSEYQDVHRDAPPLFPETGEETPAFQLAVNFPLVDITLENGPMEIVRGTHMISKEEGLRRMESGEIKLEPITMRLGDVMIRDVRGLHRGTPNYTETPRPMVVIGYSRRWLYRPEVCIHVPRATYDTLSERARHLLRFNPIVESVDEKPKVEVYQSYAY